MRSKYITLREAQHNAIISTMTYKPITLIKKVCAYSLIAYGISTIYLPTGSIWAIIGGCALLGIDYKILLNTIKRYCVASVGFVRLSWFRLVSSYKINKVRFL